MIQHNRFFQTHSLCNVLESCLHEDLGGFPLQSTSTPWFPRTVLTPNLHHGCQDHSFAKARTPADHQSKRSAKSKETLCCDVNYKIQCIPHSAFQKVESQGNCEKTDSTVQETPEPWLVTKSIWKRAEEFNPFSEVSKELFTSIGWYGVLRFVRDLFKNTMPWLFFILGSWHRKTAFEAKTCRRRKRIDSWTKSDTTSCQSLVEHDVLSITSSLFFRTKPTFGSGDGAFLPQYVCYKNTGNVEESPHTRWRKYPGTNDLKIRNAANLFLIFWVEQAIWQDRIKRPIPYLQKEIRTRRRGNSLWTNK